MHDPSQLPDLYALEIADAELRDGGGATASNPLGLEMSRWWPEPMPEGGG